MKKKIILFTGLFSLISVGLLGWSRQSESNSVDPKNSEFAGKCVAKVGEGFSESTEYDLCCIDYNEAIAAAERDWANNLRRLTDQEIPASQMIDDAYENLRTFNCWLEYICRGVLYSGYAPIESGLSGTGLTGKQLGQVPGCQLPENLTMEENYNTFNEAMREFPLSGTAAQAGSNLFVSSKINYFPSCMSDANNNQNPQLRIANANFQACKDTIELRFGCREDMSEAELTECMTKSTAVVQMEIRLKERHAEQRAIALERKLASIINKLNVMEGHVGYLSNFLEQLNARFSCYATECT